MLIDTHAHLDFENYENSFDEIISNAKDAGVEKIIIPGVRPDGWSKILELVEKYDCLYGAIGLHPSEAKLWQDEYEEKFLQVGSHKKIIAIGEIGLDYHWDKSFIDLQKEVFIKQIELAKRLNKPILVHDREAHKDCLDILKAANSKQVGVVMHCFSGSVEFAKQCTDEGFYIALGGVITFKNAHKPKEVTLNVDLDKLLLETDSPFLAPEPHRGGQNEPAYVKFVAEQVAKIKNISYETVAQTTSQNARKLFNI